METPWIRPKEFTGDSVKDRYRTVVSLAACIQSGLAQWLRGYLPSEDKQPLADAMVRFAKYISAGKEEK